MKPKVPLEYKNPLYKEGLWTIYESADPDSFSLTHLCRQSGELIDHPVWQNPGNPLRCQYCAEITPDKIGAIYKLNHFGENQLVNPRPRKYYHTVTFSGLAEYKIAWDK